MKRHVIVHYHIFKNAGTSLDRMLEQSFPGRWHALEAAPGAPLTAKALADHFKEHPGLAAVSSHTAQMPAPDTPRLRAIPLVALRHPVDRVRSAYAFERRQQADTDGAQVARRTSFAQYVEHFLELPRDRRFRNFQVMRLCRAVPAEEGVGEMERALRAVGELPWVGIVEDFAFSLRKLERKLRRHFPGFSASGERANATSVADSTLDQRLEGIRGELGGDLYQRLCAANLADWIVWERAWRLLRARPLPDPEKA